MISTLSVFLAAALGAPTPIVGPDESANTWPAATATDFKLTVELVAPAKKDADGVLHMEKGLSLTVRLKAEKDCEAVVYWIDPKGQVVQLFPNSFERDGRLKAGNVRVVPGPIGKGYELVTTPTVGEGAEFLRVVAVTGPLPASPKGEKMGAFTAYRTEEARKEVLRGVRSIVVREKVVKVPLPKDALRVAQAELKFRVKP